VTHSRVLRTHEDAPGELGLFWATKIGGPSHGFDIEGQCLLPLLCNAVRGRPIELGTCVSASLLSTLVPCLILLSDPPIEQRHKVILVSDAAWPHHPAGRAHFRLLWLHGTSPPRPVLWLETVNADFEARVNTRDWCVRAARVRSMRGGRTHAPPFAPNHDRRGRTTPWLSTRRCACGVGGPWCWHAVADVRAMCLHAHSCQPMALTR
jgi:hypothetical protein